MARYFQDCQRSTTQIRKMKLRVLSLGAGVQSSTLALMIEKGLIPKVSCGIFADTGGGAKTCLFSP